MGLKKDISLKKAFWKFLFWLLTGLGVSVVIPFLVFLLLGSSGMVTYADNCEQQTKALVPVLTATPDITDIRLPLGTKYLLLDKSYQLIDTSMNDDEYDLYFGFHEDEVKELCNQMNSVGYEELKYWYDGYYTSEGKSLFNPRSVSLALQKGKCKNYWTETGPMNEIAEYIEHNVDEVREDIVKMVAGIPVEVELEGYAASQLQLDSRDEILSAMVVFGFLSYHDGFLRIPNHELMEKFQRVLKRKSMGSVADIVNNSKNVLDATIALDGQKVAQYIEEAHDREIPFLQYNNENSLSCVITLCYLYARNYYEVTREDKSGKGFVDYLFTPKKKGYPAIILELKYNKTAQEAIDQIKRKNYVDRVRNFKEILYVGINYSIDADEHKHHDCIIEKYK